MARSSGTFKKGEKRPGQGKRGPDKVTVDARKSIARFVDDNAGRMQEWLDRIADGDPERGIAPDPAKAFTMFQAVIEYHVPKLARQEITGADGGAIVCRFDQLDMKA